MKAIIIARVSTEEQREAGNSLPAQVARLERYCQNMNFEMMHNKRFSALLRSAPYALRARRTR